VTDLVSIFVNRERLDDKKSTKLLDRVLFGDLIFDGNALGRDLKGLGERRTEEKCDKLEVFGQHVLIHSRIALGTLMVVAATDIV
jgi:hypothetical protein